MWPLSQLLTVCLWKTRRHIKWPPDPMNSVYRTLFISDMLQRDLNKTQEVKPGIWFVKDPVTSTPSRESLYIASLRSAPNITFKKWPDSKGRCTCQYDFCLIFRVIFLCYLVFGFYDVPVVTVFCLIHVMAINSIRNTSNMLNRCSRSISYYYQCREIA